ncbi:MAG: GyrI-like domain-containing protein [bacterium]
MIKILIKIIIVLLILVFFLFPAKTFKEYEHLKNPKMRAIPRQKMLVVKSIGNPNVVGGAAFKTLFKTFYTLKKNNKGLKMSAPKARWPNTPETQKNEWVGIYGLPIPATVETLPQGTEKSSPDVKIEYWEYGAVAEILHVGPYNEETPTIEKLHKFISDSGYKITGPHEEEYLKGPGMFFKGDPKKYQTIIRYCVKNI